MGSVFDPKTYLTMTTESAGSTEVIPLPVQDYISMIDAVDCVAWQKKDDPAVHGVKLIVTHKLDLPQDVKEKIGRDGYTVKQDIMLDLLENGGLDFGKGRNVALNRLREACDLNRDGSPFSFNMFVGKTVKVKIGHRPSDDGATIYTDVRGVAKAF